MVPFTIRRTSALLLLFGAATATCGQDLGELARQERVRHGTLPKHAPVLTEDDLQKEKILPRHGVPQNIAPADEWPGGATTAAPAQLSSCDPADCSLGELARELRLRKERERAAALGLAASSEPWDGSSVPAQAAPGIAKPRAARAATFARRALVSNPVGPPQRLQERLDNPPGCHCVPVRRGDSLWKLAKRHLGDGQLWTILWKANPGISDPNVIHRGALLRLPEAGESHTARGAHLSATSQHTKLQAR